MWCVCVCVCVRVSECVKGELTRGPPIPKMPLEARDERSSYTVYTQYVHIHYITLQYHIKAVYNYLKLQNLNDHHPVSKFACNPTYSKV